MKLHEIIHILSFLININNNHLCGETFQKKVDQVLQQYANEIKENYQKDQIFNKLLSNMGILLKLIKMKIIDIDNVIEEVIIDKEETNGMKS